MADDNDAVTQDLESDDPFPEVTRKERRALLGLSSLAIFMFLTGAVPKRIPALGVEFEAAEQRWLMAGLLALLVYFVVGFAFYGWVNQRKWLKDIDRARAKVRQLDDDLSKQREFVRERENKLEGMQVSLENQKPHLSEEKAQARLHQLEELKKQILDTQAMITAKEKQRLAIEGSKNLRRFRLVFDYWFPLAFAAIAIACLISLACCRGPTSSPHVSSCAGYDGSCVQRVSVW